MSIALTILLIAFCLQGLVKFAVGFLVPYPTRIRPHRCVLPARGRIISIYDSVTLVIIVALVVLLFLTGIEAAQLHHRPGGGDAYHPDLLPPVQRTSHRRASARSRAAPRKIMSYAIQARPGLAWHEIALMTALFGWALYELVGSLLD